MKKQYSLKKMTETGLDMNLLNSFLMCSVFELMAKYRPNSSFSIFFCKRHFTHFVSSILYNLSSFFTSFVIS